MKTQSKTRDAGYKILFLAITVLFLSLPVVSLAGYVGDNIAIASKAYDQQNPHTIYLADKNLWFVVWEDSRNFTTTGADIRGRFIKGNDGSFCGNEFVIAGSQGNQTAPMAAYRNKDILSSPSGVDKIVVVWQDSRGSGDSGYVKFRQINVDNINTNTCGPWGRPPGAETSVGFNGTNKWELTTVETPVGPITDTITFGNGGTDFSGYLTSPVVPGNISPITIKADNQCARSSTGSGSLTPYNDGVSCFGGGNGYVLTATGEFSVHFDAAPSASTPVVAEYQYYDIDYFAAPALVNDALFSRRSPKISFDSVRDWFWITYVESRDKLNRISEICFGQQVADWEFGDKSFPGFVMIDGDTLAEETNGLGINGADIIRNGTVRTNRKITESHGALTETYEFEYFTDLNNITVASDTTAPESFMVWEGRRQKGVLTCTCKDNNNNGGCDLPADIITDSFATSNYDDGNVHVYGLFDKEIPDAVVYSKKLDTSTDDTYYPSVGFDPVTGRFLTAWEDLRDDSLNTKIYGQLVYSGGGLYNNNFIISYEDTDENGAQDDNVANSRQTRPFVSYDPVNQRFFVIWQDGRNGTLGLENLDVFGQKVDAEGSLRGNNYAVFTLPGNQWNPTIAYNDVKNQYLTVWKDARNADISTCSSIGGTGTGPYPCSSDVYGQRFTLGQSSLTLLKTDNTPLTPPLLNGYENPPGSGTVEAGLADTKSFKIRNTGDVTLRIDYIDEDLACNGVASPRDISPFSFDGLPSQLTARDTNTIDLVPAAELMLTVRFAPTEGGSYNKCFVIESDGGTPQVNLSALSIESNIAITSPVTAPPQSPNPYDFGNIAVGDFSEATFVVRNNGLAQLRDLSINSPTPPFSIQSDGCTEQSIAPGATCDVVVRYTPAATPAPPVISNSSFAINSNDPDTPVLTVNIRGTSQGAPNKSIAPTSIDFGNVQKNQDSDPQTITITSNGTEDLTINDISSPDAQFTMTPNCGTLPATLAVGESCTIDVKFKPTSEGSVSSGITIDTNADPDVTVILSGRGVVTPDISVGSAATADMLAVVSTTISPVAVPFADTQVGGSSTRTITVQNVGTANLTISTLTNPTGEFMFTGVNCIGTLAAVEPPNPPSSCTITVSFNPTSGGFKQSSFQINSNDPDTPVFTLALSGTGSTAPDITVIPTPPTALDFGSRLIDTTTDLNITVRNDGNANLSITGVTDPTSPYSITSNGCLAAPLAPGASCTITVRFAPTVVGSFDSSIDITSNDPDASEDLITVELTGSGVSQQNIAVSPYSWNFGNVTVGTTSDPKQIRIRNMGGVDLVLTSITYPATPFRVTSDNCSGRTLAPGGLCTMTVVFGPLSAVTYYPYYLYINSNDPDTPQVKVTLKGTGVR